MTTRVPDDVDHRILELLAVDARSSVTEIGRTVGLTPPAVRRRMERLEADGIISGYTVRLNHGLLGSRIQAFIELRFAPGTQVADIDTAVSDLAEVVESFTLAGDPDAMVRVRVRDLDHLKTVVDRIRRGRRGGPKILGTRTVIVLGQSHGPSGP